MHSVPYVKKRKDLLYILLAYVVQLQEFGLNC